MLSVESHPAKTETTCQIIDCVRSHLKKYLVEGASLAESVRMLEWVDARVSRKYEPFYSSIDIRDAGFKIAPVDANLYPAGFNNICEEDVNHSGDILRSVLQTHLGFMPKKIAILPEAHTKNRYYADNLAQLKQLFTRIGIQAEIGWWSEEFLANSSNAPIEMQTTEGTTLKAYPFWKEGQRLKFEPFDPDFVLLNNDFSSGYPSALENIATPIEPTPKLGWHTRKKSEFFEHYNRLAAELAATVELDPWRLQVTTRHVSDIDFNEGIGMERIAAAADEVLSEIKTEYDRRGITEKPFVFVKSNSGTYGMGILRIESGAELLELNRREKNKMAVVKNQLEVHEVIVQEGIPTRFQYDGVYAEPAIYLLGHDLLGGFLRKNPNRGKDDNLNSKGMVFQKLCISDLRGLKEGEVERNNIELELVYGTIARLSAAAISLETAAIMER